MLNSFFHFLPTIFLIVCSLLALPLLFLGLPGNWLLGIGVCVYAYFKDFSSEQTGGLSDISVVLIVLALALISELLEFLVNIFGSKKMSVSNGAIISSLIGGFVGAIIGVPVFLIGSVIGLFLGVFIGAALYEFFKNKNLKQSLKIALALTFSRAIALFIKAGVTLIMMGLIYWCY